MGATPRCPPPHPTGRTQGPEQRGDEKELVSIRDRYTGTTQPPRTAPWPPTSPHQARICPRLSPHFQPPHFLATLLSTGQHDQAGGFSFFFLPIPVCLPLLPGIQSWYLLAKPVSREGCNPHPTCVLSCSVVSDSVRSHGLQPGRLLCPWGFLGKNTGVGCHALLQGIFLTQGSNPNLLHCRRVLYH